MYRIALNTAITARRKNNKYIFTNTPDSTIEDPDVMLDHSEDLKLLHQAISELSQVDKALILLWLDEKSYAEIASFLGITEKNVSVRLVRIRKKLARNIHKIQQR